MGRGIALTLALGGFAVLVKTRSDQAAAQAAICDSAGVMIDAELLDPNKWAECEQVIEFVLDYRSLGQADYVVEAVPEDLGVKQAVYTELEKVLADTAIVASTTSAISPTALQAGMRRPERFIVTHYAQPAQLVPVCEVVRGKATGDSAFEIAIKVLDRCHCTPVTCADTPGFVFSRIQLAILRECLAMVRDGVTTVENLEVIMKQGYAARLPAMGPFEHADIGGLDLMQQLSNDLWPILDNSTDANEGPLAELVESGRLGVKTGQGFHDWSKRDPDAFRAERDREVIRRLKVLRKN